MYSFKRATINQKVWDEDISGYVKYIGYAIPIMHRLTYYGNPNTVTIEGKKYECPKVKELTYCSLGRYEKGCSPVKGIWAEISHSECIKTKYYTGYYGRIIVYYSNKEALEFLEMLRDKLFSTPYYMYRTRDMGIDEKEFEQLKNLTRINAEVCGKPYIEPIPQNKNQYYQYHVDIDELNSFIRDLRDGKIEFPDERITISTSTDPIEQKPIIEPPKRITWRWSV